MKTRQITRKRKAQTKRDVRDRARSRPFRFALARFREYLSAVTQQNDAAWSAHAADFNDWIHGREVA